MTSDLKPEPTPEILAGFYDFLCNLLKDASDSSRKKRTVLISSNDLVNRFMLEKWNIRSSQRRRFEDLFFAVRKHCLYLFRWSLARGRLEWSTGEKEYLFGVYLFDEVRGNLTLGFKEVSPDEEWKLPK